MNEIGNIGTSHPALARIAAKHADAAQPVQAHPGHRPADSAQFSPESQLLSKLAALPDVREDLVATAKANIEAGAYDTDAVVDATIDNLAEDL